MYNIKYKRDYHFLKRFYLFIFRERGREGERGRGTSMCGCLLCAPNWGPGPQPRPVPWLGIEPAILWFEVWRSVRLHHTRQGTIIFNLCKLKWKWTCFSWCSYFLNKKITREIISLTILLHDEIAYGWSSGGKIVLNHTAIYLSCLLPRISSIQLFKI